jgi:phospholipid/cholesterol/gamma-HCH transport system ATP-binding protein
MISFEKVCFGYGKRDVLKDVTFKIEEDERVAILGGSGEGKTTMLKLILGLIRPDSGKIILYGEDISDKTEDELRQIRMKFSMVFQEGALFDSLNVKENVAFCLREYSSLSEEEIDRKVREMLSVVGVEEAIDFMPDELSGGMHRRVAIARSLAAFDPSMFLYDEATTGLDPINADNICRLIADLCKAGKGLIIVTHKVFDALKVADRFMFLKEGELIFDGGRDDLLHSDMPDIRKFTNELNANVC